MASDTRDDGEEQRGNTIGDMMDINVGAEVDEALGFDWSEDGDVYRHGPSGEERSVAFDLLWEYWETYPPTYFDENYDVVASAILDDEGHTYAINFEEGPTRQTDVTGLALFAYMDDGAEIEVVEDE